MGARGGWNGGVTWRRQNKPSNTQETKKKKNETSDITPNPSGHWPQRPCAQGRTTTSNPGHLQETKPNQTPTRCTLVKDTIILHIAKPQAASSQRTHVARIQGCARMHPVIRRPATQYLHAQTVTTRRGCGRNGTQEAPGELSARRGIGIASDEVESKLSKVAWNVGVGRMISSGRRVLMRQAQHCTAAGRNAALPQAQILLYQYRPVHSYHSIVRVD